MGSAGTGAPRNRPTGTDSGTDASGRTARDTGSRRTQRPGRLPAPALPDTARAELLDHEITRELRGLGISVAETVARHLVAAGIHLDEDPALALEHARAAAVLASRIAAVREAVGLAAYHAGEFTTALAELRAARRIDGSPRHLPVMADVERGLGRPERALLLARDPGAAELDEAGRIELLIVLSGARRDLGEPQAAVLLLQDEVTASGLKQWTPRLWYAYAEALLAAGRPTDATRWFTSAATIDEAGETDAADRAALLDDGEPDPTADKAGS
ncbi:tetratricopeptide repeat protein [Frankia sp. Cppng1_Ct_nod]|uniref:tetratricopeptide repeat protein n=1 Tax=Frankia sp. Cppng1_Ct_nod TaxID=2897162 RepID=UPI001041B974|nr:tetratricopeptide repeat protein [Frankia sp. Cppng1_Ct_nod]